MFVVDEVTVGLDFLLVVRFSHHFLTHFSFVDKPTLYNNSNSHLAVNIVIK
jgi:hypothetical protein